MVEREQLRELLKRRPFQPFRVHVKDGRVLEVRYPEINLLGQSYINIGIPVPDDPDPVFDYTVFVPLSWIDRLELLTVTAGQPS